MERSEKEIKESKFAELMNKHFAASSVPKGIHCLSLRLTDDYSSNAYADNYLHQNHFAYTLAIVGNWIILGINLGGKVNGAVETCKGDDTWVMPKLFRTYFNFSHPLTSNNLDPDECAWAYRMNISNLRAWRRTNIRETYHTWLKEALAYDKRNRTFE
ncbi:putative polygalacturonate 4-alpha-galacturonosyltransferase [Helianthus annuus]|nr:putative polygalacturonate 4-alpha-galacturonosyltransferase [Helianthus annuus]